MPETWVQSLHWEDALEKGKATHSSTLAWRIPWTIQSMGLQSRTWLSNFHYLQGTAVLSVRLVTSLPALWAFWILLVTSLPMWYIKATTIKLVHSACSCVFTLVPLGRTSLYQPVDLLQIWPSPLLQNQENFRSPSLRSWGPIWSLACLPPGTPGILHAGKLRLL